MPQTGARPASGRCLPAGLVVSPARCSQADAARAALPPCAARAAGRPPRAGAARPAVPGPGPRSLGQAEPRASEGTRTLAPRLQSTDHRPTGHVGAGAGSITAGWMGFGLALVG